MVFRVLFHYGLSQGIDYSPLCYKILFIHPICKSLHLLTPNSPSFPPPPTLSVLRAATRLSSMSVGLCLFCRHIHLCHFRFHM